MHMLLQNPIGWCDDTTNAVTGCDKISPGCAHCYAATGTRARVLRAQGIETWGPQGIRHPVAEMATKLRRLNKLCLCDTCHQTAPYATHHGKRCHNQRSDEYDFCGGSFRRIRLFADSNSDWLDAKWPIATLANFLKEIHDAPNVDFLLLTKRPENFRTRLQAVFDADFCLALGDFVYSWINGGPPPGVWLGASVENQTYADLRIPALLKIPAALHFLSVEPLLTATNLRLTPLRSPLSPAIDWVIVGGESGKNRRDCGIAAIVNVAEQCQHAGVPVYVKQDSAFKSGQQGGIPDHIWALKQFPTVVGRVTPCAPPQ